MIDFFILVKGLRVLTTQCNFQQDITEWFLVISFLVVKNQLLTENQWSASSQISSPTVAWSIYTSPFVGIKLTVIGTSCRYRCKPTYSMVTAMTAHFFILLNKYRLQCKLKKYWYLYILIYNWKKICSNTFYLSIF
jgi:hypothetical protein